MKIDERGDYLVAWNGRIWDQKPIIISAYNGVIMLSFTWVHSCN
jgi:hypothetical protein